ncbi:hypothetical protein M427DRAFT_43553 [Gonapodya prolifera JEL478]|uniref:Uncharacterized protein n=1 Tax=Gonapodya prolifera (strain JEL478) TaxID=1344416 RepID=A0A139AI93_GONPJ|nr:hypothetical protein M427DRAFT_43553 [Gonapodya prolifera JEL478]|eukprot:KXS16468.1 hypothetical protein M427DRAFT_43553 [Gonapodya prolifera JEL478]
MTANVKTKELLNVETAESQGHSHQPKVVTASFANTPTMEARLGGGEGIVPPLSENLQNGVAGVPEGLGDSRLQVTAIDFEVGGDTSQPLPPSFPSEHSRSFHLQLATSLNGETARQHHEITCHGNADGQNNLGRCHENELGVTKDLVEAARWYASMRTREALKKLGIVGKMFQAGWDAVIPVDSKVIKWGYPEKKGDRYSEEPSTPEELNATANKETSIIEPSPNKGYAVPVMSETSDGDMRFNIGTLVQRIVGKIASDAQWQMVRLRSAEDTKRKLAYQFINAIASVAMVVEFAPPPTGQTAVGLNVQMSNTRVTMYQCLIFTVQSLRFMVGLEMAALSLMLAGLLIGVAMPATWVGMLAMIAGSAGGLVALKYRFKLFGDMTAEYKRRPQQGKDELAKEEQQIREQKRLALKKAEETSAAAAAEHAPAQAIPGAFQGSNN